MAEELCRCGWARRTAEERDYHDREWGVPLHNDQRLFEFLVLEGAQAGLSWLTILRKRPAYRLAFDQFDPVLVARYDALKVQSLLENSGIVRNRLKIEAAVTNAQKYLATQDEFAGFDQYLWQFVDHRPLQNRWRVWSDVPSQTPESDRLSKDLKQRGFKFVGTTICYALMQAVGMVNDHTTDCFRWLELQDGQKLPTFTDLH